MANTVDTQANEDVLYEQLFTALEDMGYDEDRGDWWRVTYDGQDGWAIKSVINGKDVNFDVTLTGYEISK
jgi:hypothetical protein